MTTLDFGKIVHDLQSDNRRFLVEPDSNGILIRFNGRSEEPVDFKLSGLPRGDVFPRLSFVMASPVRLRNLYSTSSVRIVMDTGDISRPSRLLLASSIEGELEVAGERVHIDAESGCGARVLHGHDGLVSGLSEHVHITIRPKPDRPIPKVSGVLGRLTLDGAAVECVDVTSVHTVNVRKRNGEIRTNTNLEIVNLSGNGSVVEFSHSDSSRLRVKVVESVSTVEVKGDFDLVAKEVAWAEFHDPVRLMVLERAYEVRLSGARLALGGRSSVAADIKGHGQLGELNGGTVLGDHETGFEITSVVAAGDGSPLLDAQLENVRFAEGLLGLQDLAYAADLRRLEPHPHHLPGWDLRLGCYVPLLGPWLSDRASERLNRSYEADFMRRLSELAREKGASGSSATKIGWCSQRLRHEITLGFWERRALDVYRLLGYGERPGPAFATWLVASLVFTALINAQHGFQFNSGGAANFFDAWVTDAISPIGSILRTGSTASDSAWVYLVRAVVAVPLIVGVLALRKYTRAS